jgi:hypothetical protein
LMCPRPPLPRLPRVRSPRTRPRPLSPSLESVKTYSPNRLGL